MTWNINSLRLRLPLLREVVLDTDADIICLQETKVPDDLFPSEPLHEMGYVHQHYTGMKSYNGVAILSKHPFLRRIETPDWCSRSDCRHAAVEISGARSTLTIHNFYVPAGGDIPDPALNPKFLHKLNFLEEVTAWFTIHRPERTALVGDLNVAPLENDVWSHRQLRNIVSHTEPEITRLNAWLASGFEDAMRSMIPADQKLYTWWSYRNKDWAASNRGRRLDHLWLSHDIMKQLRSINVLRDIRSAESPSDHVPVVADVDF